MIMKKIERKFSQALLSSFYSKHKEEEKNEALSLCLGHMKEKDDRLDGFLLWGGCLE